MQIWSTSLRLVLSGGIAAMKQSAHEFLREPKARFTGRSPASFFMRVSALHFQTKEHCSRSALLFGACWQKRCQLKFYKFGEFFCNIGWELYFPFPLSALEIITFPKKKIWIKYYLGFISRESNFNKQPFYYVLIVRNIQFSAIECREKNSFVFKMSNWKSHHVSAFLGLL